MKPIPSSLVLLAALVLVSDNTATAQPGSGTTGVVYYVPAGTKKEKQVAGTIRSETPAGVRILEGKTEILVPPLEIVQIAYTTKTMTSDVFRGNFGYIPRLSKLDPKKDAKARIELLNEALAKCRDLAPQVHDSVMAERYTHFQIAYIQYLLSQSEPKLRAQAMDALEEYRKAHSDGWEILPTLNLLAHMYDEDGKLEKAVSIKTQLADLPGAPDALRQRADLELSQMLLRNKKYPAAAERLRSLLTRLKPSHPLYAQTQVQLVLCDISQNKTSGAEKQLHDAIKASTDPTLRAMAYNALGDLYRLEKKPDDAFWAYLRVDTLYNGDDNEHAKALYYLSELFRYVKLSDSTGDATRAANYRERLKDKRFAETEYAKLAASK